MARAQLELQQAILGTSLVQPVASGTKGGHVWVLSRQLLGQEKPWLKVIENLLEVAEEKKIDLHVCRRYVRKKGKMLFGWHIAVTSKGVKDLLADIALLKDVFESAIPNLDDNEPIALPISAPTSVRNPRSLATVTSATVASDMAAYRVPSDPKNGGTSLPQGVIRTTNLGRDEEGIMQTIEEIALPHVTKDLNIPRHQFGRGARYIKDAK